MSLPFPRLGRCLLVAAMFLAVGGHWAVLQTVAWSGMILDYSRTAGWTVAVEKTFSGKFPCEMCQSIAKSRQNEKRTELTIVKKIDVVHETARPFVAPIVASHVMPLADFSFVERTLAPALRPPRLA